MQRGVRLLRRTPRSPKRVSPSLSLSLFYCKHVCLLRLLWSHVVSNNCCRKLVPVGYGIKKLTIINYTPNSKDKSWEVLFLQQINTEAFQKIVWLTDVTYQIYICWNVYFWLIMYQISVSHPNTFRCRVFTSIKLA